MIYEMLCKWSLETQEAMSSKVKPKGRNIFTFFNIIFSY